MSTIKQDVEKRDSVKYNEHTNLLERCEFKYSLQDIDNPHLFRNIFPYDGIPKIAFNHRHVPINMPSEIWITDTTFRDGQQSREPFKVNEIVKIFDYLNKLDNNSGIIRATEFFLYNEKDREAIYKCQERNYEYPKITGWIRALKKDFKLVKEAGLEETGILVSCSDYHIFYKLKMTRRQAVDHYVDIIKECIDTGIVPRCHLEDITRADFYGFVVPFVIELMKLMEETKMPVKIRACDTMGYGVSLPGSVLPRSVPGIIYGLRHHAGVPSENLEWHGHNDFYKAVQNSSTAWLYGASGVNGTMFGIGERTGNTPIEAMIFEYAQMKGTLGGIKTTVITEMAEYFRKDLGVEIPLNMPFVGKNFNVTRAGIHADGLLKNEEIYNIFDTDKILNRPALVAVTKTSGASGVAHWINTQYRLKGENAIGKDNPLVLSVKEWVDNEYEKGRVIAISERELVEVIDRCNEKINFKLKV